MEVQLARWMDVIYPYVKSEQIYVCPSNRWKNEYEFQNGSKTGSYFGNQTYYSPNDNALPPFADQRYEQINLSRVAVPSETVWIGDGANTGNNKFVLSWGTINSSDPLVTTASFGGIHFKPSNTEPGFIESHLETSNMLWCDGHVKAVKLSMLNTRSTNTALHGSNAQYICKYLTIADD